MYAYFIYNNVRYLSPIFIFSVALGSRLGFAFGCVGDINYIPPRCGVALDLY